ncbi:MAG: YidB family protein [Geobacteraceae bacterium]|nr:YidB family protein [Geobacteraceae bacterium]
MGILDEIVGKVSGMLGGGDEQQSGLLGGIMEMLSGSQSGGLSGLMQTFREKGLGDVISSWVGTGENQAISADQIQEVLGSDMVQNLAAKAGIPQEEISGKLAELLPGVIDKLTPDGKLPEGGLLEKGLEMLKG